MSCKPDQKKSSRSYAVSKFLIEPPIAGTCRDLVRAVHEVLAPVVGEQAVLDAELVIVNPHEHDVLRNVSLDAIAIIPYTVVPEKDPLRLEAVAQMPGDLTAHS